MAKINLDNLMNDLRDRNAAKQDRVIVSGYLATMPMPPAVLFHPWRQPSPSSQSVLATSTTSTAEKLSSAERSERKPGAAKASRSGSPATGGTVCVPFSGHQLNAGHDCQSHVQRDARLHGEPTGPAGSNGK